MDKSGLKRHLHEESDSSSDKECLITPPKQPNIPIETKSPEKPIVFSLPAEAHIPEVIEVPETYGLDILATEASNREYIMKHESTEYAPDTPEASENEVEEFSSETSLTTTTKCSSKVQDCADARGAVSHTGEDSPKDASAKKLEEEYMVKYASVYSKELLFAVDIMTFVRHLNNLPCKWIIYNTTGEHPKSPCSHLLEEALGVLWSGIKDALDDVFEKNLKPKGINYHYFQQMILHLAQKTEEKPFNEKHLLLYSVSLAHWAVYAERNGVPNAPDFVPLVICRTIQILKDSGKIPSRFWERIAEKAVDIICAIEET